MPLVRVRICLGNKLLGEPTRPYASEVTVKAVIDRAIEPLEGIEYICGCLEPSGSPHHTSFFSWAPRC